MIYGGIMTHTSAWKLPNLDCAGCALEIEEQVGALSSVDSVRVDVISKRMVVTARGDVDELVIKTAKKSEPTLVMEKETPKTRSWSFGGLDCASCALSVEDHLSNQAGVVSVHLDWAKKTITITTKEEEPSSFFEALLKKAKEVEPLFEIVRPEVKHSIISFELIRLVVAILIFASAFFTKQPSLYLISYAIAGYSVIWRALRNIVGGKIFDEHFLMSVASIGALAVGEVAEAAAVMLLYLIGEYLQEAAVQKSRNSILATLDLHVNEARVVDGSNVMLVPSEEVQVGSIIRVLSGEKIPLDGIVLSGTSTLDMQSLTGEALPLLVEAGSEVLSSAVNLTGSLEIEVTKIWEDSTAAKILHLVEESAAKKAPTERFITTFARYYTPAVVGAALLLFFIPFIITGNKEPWLYRALVFLVVSCPCALVISVPLSYFAGIGSGARRGIIIKGGNYLEALAKADSAIFDKTGTLTTGEFSLASVDRFTDSYSEEELLLLAGSLEAHSTHPLAQAFVLDTPPRSVTNVQEYAGKGIVGMIDGKTMSIGNNALYTELGAPVSEHGALLFVIEGVLVARFVVTDTIKREAPSLMKRLRSFGYSTLSMISGDGVKNAQRVGTELGLDHVYGGLLPNEKQEQLFALGAERPHYFYVGDGMNDAPSLAASNVGIAIGSGASDAAIESADVVILPDDLNEIGNLVSISKKTARIVRENIALALGVKALAMVLAALGYAPMWVAVIADTGVTFLAVLNALRLLIITPSR